MKRRTCLAVIPVIVLLLLALSRCVGSQDVQEQKLTPHGQLLQKTLVDLHNVSLDANKDLNLATADPEEAAQQVLDRIGSTIHDRLTKLFSKATTPECRAMIGEHYGYFMKALGTEQSMPFDDFELEDTCNDTKYDFDNLPEGMHIGHVQNRTYQPPRNETAYIHDPANLKLLYGILTHDNPAATVRLMEVLYEPGYTFVLHVDGKETADDTYTQLVEYASTRDHVHVIPTRIRVNWGGFTMVNATLQILKYVFDQEMPMDFDKFVHLASTSYPIASNFEIRNKIAQYPLDANLMHVIMKPTNPHPHSWHYFVECDDSLHRIYRLKPLSHDSGGIDLHTSSQWFILSKEFAEYLAHCEQDDWCRQFLEYCRHVVVADETFFGSVLRNTHFCSKHHNWNFLHLQFDRWESDLDATKRDPRKCMMPSPDHCGRSPTTMTMDYMDILELTGDLFARKFLDEVDSRIKDVLDMKRNGTLEKTTITAEATNSEEEEALGLNQTFAGHGVLIVAKDTVNDKMPLCLGLGPAANQVRLVPCFHDGVPETLATDWIKGAVIPQETAANNRWEFSPCSTDGALQRLPSGELQMLPGQYSPTGPRCMMKQVDGLRAGRCMDGDFGNTKPGGKAHVFPCVQRWHQFFSVGNGTLAPNGALHVTIPSHIVRNFMEKDGFKQEAHLCLGVYGRGNDEDFWKATDSGRDLGKNKDDLMPIRGVYPDGSLVHLKKWKSKQLITTPCSNTDSVIEWLYVPYILEDPDQDKEEDEEGEENEGEENEGDEEGDGSEEL